ncbi:MAG: uroporphyrinogen-III C-methyltransferase [Ectothiorhodospiraceae bacterium]|nr:uroporphyrinogen-III C-methyltransferase [Ectothiorhodospiraceae bacterium]
MKKNTPNKPEDASLPDTSKKELSETPSLEKNTTTDVDNNKASQKDSAKNTPDNKTGKSPLLEKMSRPEKNKKKESSVVTDKKQTSASGKIVQVLITGLLLIIALSAGGLSAYDYWLLQAQPPINTQLKNTQTELMAQLNILQQQIKKTNSQLSKEVQARLTVESEHQAVNAALQGITEKLGRSTIAWRMAEVEYLLTVANHRLTLAQDRQTAMAVFATADSRLKAIGDPSLLTVRKKIASELTALRAMPNVDIPGLAVQIGSLAETVDELPLLDKKRVALVVEKNAESSPLDWQDIPAAVWNDVKSLVKVRRHQQPTEPLLPPKQAWFLYQNLQLKLEQARLAVLKENTALFSQSLNEVSIWLSGYFESESAAVISMQAMVKKLSIIDLRPEVPDVSGSLRELRRVMNDRSPLSTSLIKGTPSIKQSSSLHHEPPAVPAVPASKEVTATIESKVSKL